MVINMAFKWPGSFIVDHSNHYNYVPIAFFYIPQVRTRVSLEKVLCDRSYSFSSITFEKTRIPNNLEMWKYTAPAPWAEETSQHFSMECTQKFPYWWHDTTPQRANLDIASDLLKQIFSVEWLIRGTPTVGWWDIISREFLHLFLRWGNQWWCSKIPAVF